MVWGGPASSNLLWLFAAHLLRQERSNFPLLFLEPQAFLAPGPRPAAGCILISTVSSKGQHPLSMLSSPIHSAYLLAPRGLRWQTVPSGQGEEAGRGPPMLPLCAPPDPQLRDTRPTGLFSGEVCGDFQGRPKVDASGTCLGGSSSSLTAGTLLPRFQGTCIRRAPAASTALKICTQVPWEKVLQVL